MSPAATCRKIGPFISSTIWNRAGVEQNVRELQRDFPGRVLFTQASTLDRSEIEKAVNTASAIYHLAAQVAVTTSLDNPLADLKTNLSGDALSLGGRSSCECAATPSLYIDE